MAGYDFKTITSANGTDPNPDIRATFAFTATDLCNNSVTIGSEFIVRNSHRALAIGAQDVQVESDGAHNGRELQEWLALQGGAILDSSVNKSVTSWNFLMAYVCF